MRPLVIVIAALLVIAVVVAVENLWARRAGHSIPGRTAVRCSKGHLFWATWVEGGSLTTVRLGPLLRFGRCPAAHHWALLRPVKPADLTESERRALAKETQT